MKTFEEIFDSIIEEREENERKQKEELERIKRKGELESKIITAYQFIDDFRRRLSDIKQVNEFIENEKLMDLIFEKFREQVESGYKKLYFKKFINSGIPFNIIQEVLLVRLHNELPSYDITILQGKVSGSYKNNTFNKYGYELEITAEKNPLKDKSSKPAEVKEEIPYVGVDFYFYGDEIRDFVAQRIFELLETIPQLDKEELSLFKEIGVVKEYQPMQVENISFNRPAKPEIISVRIFSNIDDGVLEKLKNLFIINDGTHHYKREFSYSLDDDCNCVINILKSWGLKEI